MARASRVENRARALCIELARVTDSRPMQYRMAQTIAKAVGQDEAAADAAIAHAIEKRWLIGEGKPPYSICLTNDGRAMAASVPGRKRQPGSSAER